MAKSIIDPGNVIKKKKNQNRDWNDAKGLLLLTHWHKSSSAAHSTEIPCLPSSKEVLKYLPVTSNNWAHTS